MIVATKQSLILHGTPVPASTVVMHICDNPPCVRPDHLKVGSPRDNNLDMMGKGRAHYAKGGELPQAKLSESDVRMILSDSRPNKELALVFNVSVSSIRAIRSRRNWKHVAI